MTKAFGFAGFGCSHRVSLLPCFSKFWRRLDVAPLLQARALELVVSIPARPERPFEGNACFRALLPGKGHCFRKNPFLILLGGLRRISHPGSCCPQQVD